MSLPYLRAGVALSRLAAGAPFSVTSFQGHREQRKFGEPVEHKLQSADPEAIIKTIASVVKHDPSSVIDGFAVSYPIATPHQQREALKKANYDVHSHQMAFLNGYDFEVEHSEGDLQVLFMDLTPGQVAANLASGIVTGRQWYYNYPGGGEVILGDVSNLKISDVVDKLITPIIPASTQLRLVGIYRPDGAYSELSSSALEALFPDVPVKWLTLADLSYGSTVIVARKPTGNTIVTCATYTSLPLGVTLSDEKIVTVVHSLGIIPRNDTAVFTSSEDDQTTATIRFTKGVSHPNGEITLWGLPAKPKGELRIQVSVEVDISGDTAVTIEELSSGIKTQVSIPNIINTHTDDYNKYTSGTDKQANPTPDDNGVVGSLPP